MSKYKYYFKKPKSEITKDIFSWLSEPARIMLKGKYPNLALGVIIDDFKEIYKEKKYNKKKVYDTFYRLKKQGCIKINKINKQIYIELTEEGREKADWMQIGELKIKKPKKWDKKWRIVMFDISNIKKLYREVFRGKLKELGFYPLQKSIWVSPYKCRDEIDLLKDFLGLKDKEVRFIITEDIGEDLKLRKIFKV